MPLGQNATKSADETRTIRQDARQGSYRMVRIAWQIMKFAFLPDDARGVQVEDIAVQDQRELFAADALEKGGDHGGKLALGRECFLAIAHP